MKTVIPTIALIVMLASIAAAQEKKESPVEPLTTGGAVLVSITATIESVDLGKREVTFKGPLGIVVTYTEALAVSLEKAPGLKNKK
jgi:uncharacterized protein (AIM24 family)